MGRKPRSDTEFIEIIKEFGKPVETEEELIELAELINMEREFDNFVHQTNKPLLDIDYIKHRYKLISKRTATKTFMQQHDCRNFCIIKIQRNVQRMEIVCLKMNLRLRMKL